MIQNKHKLAFLLCLLLMATTAFGASEAEYKKLAKTWTLNADGSQEFRYNMELTLFTHTAMNGTYGESFIVYNPQYQELKINSSYTRQKDGTIIKTPDNAFVEVLPRNAADAPAYNHLKAAPILSRQGIHPDDCDARNQRTCLHIGEQSGKSVSQTS